MINQKLPRRLALSALIASFSYGAYAQSPVIKVDLDHTGRPLSQVNEPGYESWVVTGVDSATQTFGDTGVTVTLSRHGNEGSRLRTNWYSAGIQAPHFARLVSDGVTVDDGNNGGAILMNINGLPAGEHTLLVFLNTVDNPANNTFSPVDISVNGSLVIDDFVPSERALTPRDAQSAYLRLNSDGSTDIQVLFEAETSFTPPAGDTRNVIKNVFINGFEFNTPDIDHQATSPIPNDRDNHVDADEGSAALSWTAADSTVSHDVYFGISREDVEQGISGTYIGNQTATQVVANNLYSGQEYFWRVDQVNADGIVTKGDVWSFRPRQLAFPGAEGYGRFAMGGRGGQVVKVTNLNDSGPGSLREAITNDVGPRTIIFDVGGIIQLESRLPVSQSFITIAGQTAPGNGILVRSAPLGTSGSSDVIIQHMRVRLGYGGDNGGDGMGMQGTSHSIIDRSSISWTIDEAFSSRSARDITLQRTLISEALNAADHQNYEPGNTHGFAASIGGDIGSFHHNLLAHNDGRNWSMAGGLDGDGFLAGRLDIFNNVVYNWRRRTTDGGAHEVNFVNNYYKPGPATETNRRFALNLEYDPGHPGTQRYYCSGNVVEGHADESTQQNACRIQSDNRAANNRYPSWVNEPFFPSHAAIHSAGHAYKNVLSDVGASQPVLDDHDIRMINETHNREHSLSGSVTGYPGLPDHEDDAGGYVALDFPTVYRAADWDSDGDGLPDWWERLFVLNPHSASGDFSDANLDTTRDGYTELEYYLQWKSELHFMVEHGESVTLELADVFRGYTDAPTYSVANVMNGTATLNEADGTVSFTAETCGLGAFELVVVDADGDSMTRPVGVFMDSETPGECVGEARQAPSVIPEPEVILSTDGDGGTDPGTDPGTEEPRKKSSGNTSLHWLLMLLGLGALRKYSPRKTS